MFVVATSEKQKGHPGFFIQIPKEILKFGKTISFFKNVRKSKISNEQESKPAKVR